MEAAKLPLDEDTLTTIQFQALGTKLAATHLPKLIGLKSI